MASLKYEELKACLKKGGNIIATLKLCLETFSKNDEAFHKAVDHMSFWCPQLFSLAFSECLSTRILAVKCINLFMPKFVDRLKPFSDDWWKQLKQDITKKYAVILAEKLDAFEDWDILWKLCVSIVDIELYQSTTLVNALLKVAEKAFRDKKLVITAFNCWKHFITVYAKSPNVMFSSKQISLLITPLTAKSHYTLKYCEIKLEVWNTLISLVVDKSKQAVDVIIAPLMNFLYGPLKMPIASSFPELVDRCAESYVLILNNPNVFKYINESISSYLPKVILSLAKSKIVNEELILRVWKTFFAKVKQLQTLSPLNNAVESVTSYSNELNEENICTFIKLIEVFMAEQPTLVCKNLHKWILCDSFLSIKLPDNNSNLEAIIKGYEHDISLLESLVGHLFNVPLNFKRGDESIWNTCLSNLSELWMNISDVVHLFVERDENKSINGLLSSDAMLQLLLFPVECLFDKWCSRIMKHWRLLCNDSVSLLPASENVTEFGSRLIKNLIVTLEKHPKSLTSVVYAALEVCGILLSSVILKGNVKQAVPLITCIVKLIEHIESVPSRQDVLLNEALPKISLWSNLHVELNTDLLSVVESIVAMAVIGSDVASVKLKNKITKVSRLIRGNVAQSGAKNWMKETPSTPKSAIINSNFMHRLDKANRNRQNSNEDLRKLLSTPEKAEKEGDKYVVIPPKTKVTPLTKHQKEVMKSRKILPAMYNGLSQDTQSQDSQALDVILSVVGSRPVRRTLDSKNENAIDELLDEFETKDDSLFMKQSNQEIKQEPKVNGSIENEMPKARTDLKDNVRVSENKAASSEKPRDLSEDDTQKLESESNSRMDIMYSENESKKEVCSKVMSLLKDECKKSNNNFGNFFNILINEPHPALYLFHKLKEIAENSGDHDAEFELIYKEFTLDNLTSLFNTLNAAIINNIAPSDTKETTNEVNLKGSSISRKSPKNSNTRMNITESVNSSENDIWCNSNCVSLTDDAVSDLKKHSNSQGSNCVENCSDSKKLTKSNESTSKATEMTSNKLLSPASRAKRKINPPKRYSPTKKLGDGCRTPTKISPKLLRSRKSLTLPKQSSPIRIKPRRSLNMRNQASALVDEKKATSSNALKKKIPTIMDIGEENSEKCPDENMIKNDCGQETVGSFEITEKESTKMGCDMDFDISEDVCSMQESCQKSESLKMSALENCTLVLSKENSLETLKGSGSNCEKPTNLNSKCLETVLTSENDVDGKITESSCSTDKENEFSDSEVCNSSVNDLNESRDFSLTLVKTPKLNGDISMQESSPEIFNSVNTNEMSDVFSIYGDDPEENKSKAEENNDKIDHKGKKIKNSSALKKKNLTLFKNVTINGENSSSQKEKTFVSLDSWIKRSSKQSEFLTKSVEFSQNSDIIESSQPDIPLSSFKQNKSISVSSPIMTQFNSSIYCSPKSAVESEPNSESKPKVARKLILNEKESSGIEPIDKSRQEIVNNENTYNELSKKVDSDDNVKLNGNINFKLNENTKVLSPRNQYLGRTALMMNMAIGDDSKLSTPPGKTVQKESSVTPSPPRTPQHLNSVGKKWVKRRYISDAPPTPSILKKSRNDENDARSKVKLVSFSDPPMIEVLEFSTSDPQKDTVYGLDVTGLTENSPDDYSTQGSIPEIPEVSSTKVCYSWLTECRDPIDGIVPLLVESKWHSALKEKFDTKNIKTIGCLASLTELQACQLPVGEPRLFRIKNALKEYHRNLQERRKEADEQKKYEKSKFMCKFLMPACIDKAIMKDKDILLNNSKKIDTNNTIGDEGLKINSGSESSISIDSSNVDSFHAVDRSENIESKMSVDIVETTQTKESNRNESSAPEVISVEKEKTDDLSTSKEVSLTSQKTKDQEEESNILLTRKQISKKDVTKNEVCEEETIRNKNAKAAVAGNKSERQESSVRSGAVFEQTSLVEKDGVIITGEAGSEYSKQWSRMLSSDSDLENTSSLSISGQDLPTVTIEDKQCQINRGKISADSSVNESISKVNEEKSATITGEKRKIVKFNKVSTFKDVFVCIEKLKEKSEESEGTCESSKLLATSPYPYEQTEPFSQSKNSESVADQPKCTNELVSLSEVAPAIKDVPNKSLEDALPTESSPLTCDEKLQEKAPSEVTSDLISQKEARSVAPLKSAYFADEQDKERNGTTMLGTSGLKVKTTPRLLRKRKAPVDCEEQKSSKMLKSSDAKKLDRQEQKQTESFLEEKESENKKNQPLLSMTKKPGRKEEKQAESFLEEKESENKKNKPPLWITKKPDGKEEKQAESSLGKPESGSKKNDLLESSANKWNRRKEKHTESPLEEKRIENERLEPPQLNENSGEQNCPKQSVTLTVERASSSIVTSHDIEVPVEYCDERSKSISEATQIETCQNVCAPETSILRNGLDMPETLEDLMTRHCKSKKELLKILFHDEDPSSCVALLKDSVLNRVDVKRELFDFLLNDEQLGVKFCVKF